MDTAFSDRGKLTLASKNVSRNRHKLHLMTEKSKY